MYHVTVNGTFEVVADREELYNLLEQQEGLREAVKLLRDLDNEQDQERKAVEKELKECVQQVNSYAKYLLQPKHIADVMVMEKVLTEVEILTDSDRFNYSEFWRCK